MSPTLTDLDLAPRLRLAVNRLARRLRQQGDEPLTPSQQSALIMIEARGPITLGDLAAAERVQPPTMTRIVAALAEQGFLERVADETDRRVARVEITSEGRKLLDRSRTRKTAYLAARLRRLSPEERDTVERALPFIERLVEDDR
jgi:DNA-binding MarR family transcriptional regulator